MLLLVILAYSVVAVPEILSLRKKKKKKEMWLYSVAMIFSFVISVLLVAGIELPSPMNILDDIVAGLSK